LGGDEILDLIVQHEHDGGTSTTDNVGEGTLEETTDTFLGHDLGNAISHTVVHLVGLGLGSLNLETTLHGIKGVSDDAGSGDGNLGDDELGSNTDESEILLVRVEGLDGILKTELGTTVHDNTHGRGGDTVVQGKEAVGLDGLHEAVTHARVLLDATQVSTEDGTDVNERVHDGIGQSTGGRTRGDLRSGEPQEVGLLVVLGEQLLDGILEGQVASGGGDVTHAVGNVTAPLRADTELGDVTGKAVAHARVRLHLTGQHAGVGGLILDGKLNFFDGGRDGLGDGTGDTSGGQVDQNIGFVLRHLK